MGQGSGAAFTVSVDVAMILMAVAAIITALPALVAILINQRKQSREREADRKILLANHALGNDHYTRLVEARLSDLRRWKIVIERLIGDDMSEAEMEILVGMESDIDEHAAEVRERDRTARRIARTEDPSKGD